MNKNLWICLQRKWVARKDQDNFSCLTIKMHKLNFFAIVLSCDLKTFNDGWLSLCYHILQICFSISLYSEINQTGNCLSAPLMMCLITRGTIYIPLSVFSITCIQVLCPYILEVSINLSHTNISFMSL